MPGPGSGRTAPARRVVLIMAFATGAIIANLYYVQPLAETLSRTFHTSSALIGLVITLIQIGYAIGLATLVPLGDLLERRRLLVSMLVAAMLAQCAMAAAPSLAVFCGAAVVVGLTSAAVQVIVPFAAQLAPEGRQGQIVGTVMSGLLVGILLSRTVSGLIASLAGWRAVFGFGAALTAVVAAALWRELPTLPPAVKMRYPALLGSVLQLIRDEPVLRLRMVYGGMAFASFSCFWTSVGFLLARPPYGWNNAEIGAFALLGAAGALAAKFAGRLADKGLAPLATGGFLLTMALSYLLSGTGAHSVVALGLGVAAMDLGCQGTHISNQSLIYRLRPQARSRLNTAYMTFNFLAAAAGSALSAAAYVTYGWTGVCVIGAAFPAVALAVWVAERAAEGRRSVRARHAETRDGEEDPSFATVVSGDR